MLHEAQGGGHDADFNDNIPATNQQQALDTGASGSLGGESILESLSAEMKRGIGGAVRAVTQGAARPRILVCTPSNAACDELLKRVMQQGFRDGEGIYTKKSQLFCQHLFNSSSVVCMFNINYA